MTREELIAEAEYEVREARELQRQADEAYAAKIRSLPRYADVFEDAREESRAASFAAGRVLAAERNAALYRAMLGVDPQATNGVG